MGFTYSLLISHENTACLHLHIFLEPVLRTFPVLYTSLFFNIAVSLLGFLMFMTVSILSHFSIFLNYRHRHISVIVILHIYTLDLVFYFICKKPNVSNVVLNWTRQKQLALLTSLVKKWKLSTKMISTCLLYTSRCV